MRCFIGNTVKTLCEDNNIELIAAPAQRHWEIGLVERLIKNAKTSIRLYKDRMRNEQIFNVNFCRERNSST